MSDLIAAANEVRKMLKGFKAIEEVSAALERVGSIENAGKEATQYLAIIGEDISSAKSALDNALTEVAEAKDQAKKVTADAKTKAEAKILKAEEDAALIVSAAKDKETASAKKLAKIDSEIVDKTAAVASLMAELSEADAKIAKAKAYLAKLTMA
jgi:chromosome segregation ATPase